MKRELSCRVIPYKKAYIKMKSTLTRKTFKNAGILKMRIFYLKNYLVFQDPPFNYLLCLSGFTWQRSDMQYLQVVLIKSNYTVHAVCISIEQGPILQCLLKVKYCGIS